MTQLVITLVSYATIIILIGFLGLVVTGLWAFVEFIMILVGAGSYEHDAYGYPSNVNEWGWRRHGRAWFGESRTLC